MSIRATCSCGAAFAAKPELAGKRVRCPTCRQPFRVPQAERPDSPITVRCQCGQGFKAKSHLAGKRVKCPACAQPLAIPAEQLSAQALSSGAGAPYSDADPLGLPGMASGGDPLGLGGMASGGDPLGLGGMASGGDPLASGSGWDLAAAGSLPAASLMPSMPVAKSPPTGKRRKSSRSKKRETLIAAAGYVAMGYGAFQVLFCAQGIINGMILLARAGVFSPFSLGAHVWSFAFLVLGGWLAKSGYDIVQGDRGALERAGQASMIYIGLAILQLVFMVFGLVAVFGLAGTNGLALVLALLLAAAFRLILLLPPAFILHVDREYSSKR